MSNTTNDIKISKAKGRPMLTWVGKKPLDKAIAYPAQKIESFNAPSSLMGEGWDEGESWADWPDKFDKGGLLFHGDNKDVLAHLLANGFRGKVKLIYIDPPFDSGADYVRKVQLRGKGGSAKIEGEEYTLGEQVQYTDIWANDNYLQFMYERLLMLKELLSENGSIWLHCDPKRSHYLKVLMDEVFGSDNFKNEISWQRSAAHSDSKTYSNLHDILLFYTKSSSYEYHQQYLNYTDEYVTQRYRHVEESGRRYMDDNLTATGLKGGGYEYSWKGIQKSWRCPETTMEKYEKENRIHYSSNGVPRLKRYLDEMKGLPISDVWTDLSPVNSQASEREDYPTQKPEKLISRIVRTSTSPNDCVLDCFVGSGTTISVAQKLGRRWIGCDINKGAIQTTAKRLQTVIQDQANALNKQKQGKLIEDESEELLPAQLAFSSWRVNDYDLQIQHNEAVELACEHIGITRSRSDSFFDGRLGNRLVKIIPFNHPLTPLDLEDIEKELQRHPEEQRDITVVCLGMELASRAWVEQHNRNRPINRYHVIELRTDSKYGGFIKHEPLIVSIDARRDDDQLQIEVTDVFSPTIMQRLNMEEGLFRAHIDDWRSVVDCIMIDTDYNGEVFNIALSDIPAKKTDLVSGSYQLPAASNKPTSVAVKVIDMLGEEVIITAEV